MRCGVVCCCFVRGERRTPSLLFCLLHDQHERDTLRATGRRKKKRRKQQKLERERAALFLLLRGFSTLQHPGSALSFSHPFSLQKKKKLSFFPPQVATSRAPCSSTSSPEPWTRCARGPTGRSSAPTTSSSARLVVSFFTCFHSFFRDPTRL